MERLVSYLIYFISLILFIAFSIIFITENSNIVSKLYKNDIINLIQKNSSLTYNFKKLSVRWTGLDPSFIFEEVSLHNENVNHHYLDSEKLILKINFFKSLSKLSVMPEEVNLVKSNIDLVLDDDGIFIKDYNFLGTNTDINKSNFDSIKYRVTDSNIRVNDKINSYSHELININMVILQENDNVELFTTFNHQSTKEIIHLASSFSVLNNKVNGKIYSQGVNLNIDDPVYIYKNMGLMLDKLNYTFWADISDNNIINVNGYFGAEKSIFFNKITKDRLTINNFNSQVSYNNTNSQDHLELLNLSFDTNDNKYDENYMMLTMKEDVLSSISINTLYVNDLKAILKLFTLSSKSPARDSMDQIEYGQLSKIYFNNLDNKQLTKYMFSFNGTGFRNKIFSASNISGKIKGDYQKGYLKLNSQDVDVIYQSIKYPLSEIGGDVYLKYINGKLLISSNNLRLDNNHSAKILGSFSANSANYKVEINGGINNILSQLPLKLNLTNEVKKTNIKARYNVDYRVYEKNDRTYAFGAISLSDLLVKNDSTNIALNAKQMRINFFDKYYQSYNSEIFLNNTKFIFSLDTDISGRDIKYIASSSGQLSDTFIKEFITHKFINTLSGESKADIGLVYDLKNKKISMKLTSNLEGMAFNIISPFNKSSDEPKNFQLAYSLQKNRKNRINIKYESYDIELSKVKSNLYAIVDSPYLSGTLKLPDTISSDNRLTARLKYFDLNKFQGIADPAGYPYLDMDMKRVKINDYYFNDFKIRTSPLNNGMLIDQLDFANSSLSMTGNGRWLNSKDGQFTLFDAKFKSNNFGKSLDTLGYKNLIKNGSLSSQLIGQWEGSPDFFSLNNFDGKITLNLSDGEFLQVSKQSRAIGQLLGLFSISSLQKRLSLDFSDFFSSGLAFDDMNGEFIFLNSQAKANNLVLKGSFGEMRVNGSSDLKNKTHDQLLVYIPDLSSMSLISGTLLGGPVGALASIFYDKFLEQIGIDTNQLAAVEYSIQGSWDNPEIKVIEPFKPITN